ncbi:uncharacterized protein LOC106092929 [Stomoxys calcitrans]|uniref:uncharacterized protein LOC106092929 n=1 Tax=Stomoxys calcitrans TaxID=35570 RepID=UPI0027E376E7|nr:uncharacterized protein LOC106092929 [Stomoxys calcitrans]
MIPDDSVFYDRCQGANPISDYFYLDDFIMEYVENGIAVSGTVVCQFKELEPTDRIHVHIEVFKFQRGAWQLTPFTMIINDFCPKQFAPTTPWYQMFFKHVVENDRKCFNRYNQTYHLEPFTLDLSMEMPMNMEGRWKVELRVTAYKNGVKKYPFYFCAHIVGDVYKVI